MPSRNSDLASDAAGRVSVATTRALLLLTLPWKLPTSVDRAIAMTDINASDAKKSFANFPPI